MTTKDILTKDHLTRDEARKAIAMLILRRDNLNIIMMSAFAILIGFISFNVTVGAKFSSFLVRLAIIIDLLILIIALSAFFGIKDIDRRANELAKKHNLTEFLGVISGKKYDIKAIISAAVVVVIIIYVGLGLLWAVASVIVIVSAVICAWSYTQIIKAANCQKGILKFYRPGWKHKHRKK